MSGLKIVRRPKSPFWYIRGTEAAAATTPADTTELAP
jgi:hypothetical protein